MPALPLDCEHVDAEDPKEGNVQLQPEIEVQITATQTTHAPFVPRTTMSRRKIPKKKKPIAAAAATEATF